jgi:hypothetical protein
VARLWKSPQQADAPPAAKLARPITELRAWDHIGRDSSLLMPLFSLW